MSEPLKNRPVPRYYIKGADAIYRRRDGRDIWDMVDGEPPDQVLTRSGWRHLYLKFATAPDPVSGKQGSVGGGPDPALLFELQHVDEAEARRFAGELGLPLDGW
jgi:hypothetical protein